MLINVESNEQIAAREAAEALPNPEPKSPPIDLNSLAGYLLKHWERAKRGRQIPERRMLKNLRAREGEYESDKLAAIQQVMGETDPIFMKITETKCRAAESWIKDVIFQPGEEPWDLKPTPIPELPPSFMQKIQMGAMQAAAQQVAIMVRFGYARPDPEGMRMLASQLLPEIKKEVEREIQRAAKQAAEKMKLLINDQFHQGGWHDALGRTMYDLTTFGTAILKGPTLRREPVAIRDMNPQTGVFSTTFDSRIIPTYRRVNPLDFWPSPDATADSIPWSFEKTSMSRKNLSGLIGIPGFDPMAIREILRFHVNGGLHEWTNVDQIKAQLEEKDSIGLYETELIDCLEFCGTAPGKLLIDWGLDPVTVSDPENEYDIVAWLIGRWVIKAMLNPNQLEISNYHTCGFSERPDSFWHKGVPELIEHIQTLANACARAIVMNIGIASGPQIDLNVERLADGENEQIYPWKVWRTTDKGMMETKAVNFYQPNLVTARLLEVFKFCLEAADDDSGVPRYVHTGETRGGGAGETASGLSMLMGHAAKGIKAVIKNLDRGVISKSVEAQYYHNLIYEGADEEMIGDLKIIAKGSSYLINKEQQSVRRTELLERTNNPADLSIMGLRGRAKLLQGSIEGLDLDPEEIIGSEEQIEEVMRQNEIRAQQEVEAQKSGNDQKSKPKGKAPASKQRTLDKAGNPVAGRDHQLFESREGVNP